MRQIIRSNDKYGDWTCLYFVSKNGRGYWHCKCSCGIERDVLTNSLTSGKSTGCGHNKKAKNNSVIGTKFGALTVLSDTGKRKSRSIIWKCKCDCGSIGEYDTYYLRHNSFPNCGCYDDKTGKQYGDLTVLGRVGQDKHRYFLWRCRCSCGNTIIVNSNNLNKGNITHCTNCKRSASLGELNIARCLIANHLRYKAEYTFNDLKDKRALRYDFALLDKKGEVIRLIEFDGEQHTPGHRLYTPELGIHDQQKNDYAKRHNIPLIRIPYSERDSITLEKLIGPHYLV